MEVDCNSEINEEESHNKMDKIESGVGNSKERNLDVVQPSDLDKILEDLLIKTNVENANEKKSDMLHTNDVNKILEELIKPNVENAKEINVDVVQPLGLDKVMEDLIKPKVENAKESKLDDVRPSDMDRILEDCNKYLHECEEVLQGCAKYLEECDDSETGCSDDEVSNTHADKYHIPKDSKLDGTHQVNGDDALKEPKINGKKEKNKVNVKDNGNDTDVVKNKKHKKSKPEGLNVPCERSKKSKTKGAIPDTTNQAKAEFDIDGDNVFTNGDRSNNGECNSELAGIEMKMSQNQSEQVLDAVRMKISSNQSDDSEDDGESTAKLVSLRIQEEFDGEMERIKSDMEEIVRNKVVKNSLDDSGKELEAVKSDSLHSGQVSQNRRLSDEVHEVTNESEDTTVSRSAAIVNSANDSNQVSHIQTDINQDQKNPSDELTEEVSSRHEELPLDKQNQETDADREKRERAFENKMKALEEELVTTKTALRSAHNLLAGQQTRSNSVIMSLKLELYKTQTALKQEKMKSHQQLSDVISHLTLLEGNLRKSQIRFRKEVRSKNVTIEEQKMEVLKLREQNEQLLNAIKEICANGGMNGYMREKQSTHSEKKGHNGKLGMVKDKFLMKNRSSLELNNFNLEKFNLKNQRLYSSQEDLKNLNDDAFEQNSPGHEKSSVFSKLRGTSTRGSKQGNKNHRKNLQNFFTEAEQPKPEMSKSHSDSSQISDTSSGVFSMSDQDLTIRPSSAGLNGHNDHFDDDEDDDDDGRFFSFSSTHINTVIDEEEALGNAMSHSGQMMSMGSMPMLAHVRDDPGQRLYSSKDRPHSLSSVDLISIQRQAEKLSKFSQNDTISETSTTPPPSPSYNNNKSDKSEMTPFQTFKTMFKRKGNKNKGTKKRSVSLSQTTNNEYSEALKKHFQKYDMH